MESRVVKIKNIKKQNLLYGFFNKQSTQKTSNQKMKLKERDTDKSLLEYVQCMYNNVSHIWSQASDWNCCVKRLFVCTTVHIPYSTYHVKTNPSQMTTLI